MPGDVRSIDSLARYRQRRHLVIVCRDDPERYERARGELAALRAELLVEREPRELSRRLGRPSVTVVDRYGSVGAAGPALPLAAVLEALEAFELSCPECGPIAWGDPGHVFS